MRHETLLATSAIWLLARSPHVRGRIDGACIDARGGAEAGSHLVAGQALR